MPRWTQEQGKAITTKPGNILVSAGAGSGKTAVLTERILRRILGLNNVSQCDIDKLLIVTFTEAAAAEMKARIFKKLGDVISGKYEEELSSEDHIIITDEIRQNAARQQMLISGSYITTIDGLCKRIVDSNICESGIEPGYSIADDTEYDDIFRRAADDVLEAYLENEDNVKKVTDLSDAVCKYRSDAELVELIKRVISKSESVVDSARWIQESKDQYDSTRFSDFSETVWGEYLISESYKVMQMLLLQTQKLINLSEEHDLTYLTKPEPSKDGTEYDNLYNLHARIESFVENKDKTWDGIRKALDLVFIGSYKSKPRNTTETQTAAHKYIKDEIKRIMVFANTIKGFFAQSSDECLSDVSLVRPLVDTIATLAILVRDKVNEYKARKNLVTFGDIEHAALKLLMDNGDNESDVALTYRNHFDEVYTDEYQDTNKLQEMVLKLLSKNKGDEKSTKRFMVGDVKQCIYQFRQADPELFLNKYLNFKTNPNATLIDLNGNFRSRKGVLDSVNELFTKTMSISTCGMPYGESESLIYKAKDVYDVNDSSEYKTEIINIATYKDESEPDFKIRPQDAEFIEIANRIHEMISSRMQVIDKDTRQPRDIRYSDICVLLRTAEGEQNEAPILLSILQNCGISATYQSKSGFFDRHEIMVLISFMQVLDNPLQDVPLLCTLMHIYGVSCDTIAKVQTEYLSKKANFEKNDKDVTFYEKMLISKDVQIQSVVERIKILRERAQDLNMAELVYTLMHENEYYEALMTLPDSEMCKQTLLSLMEIAGNYDKISGGLFGFVKKLERMQTGKKSIVNPYSGSGNSVQIMTIHGSKGLEFPVVFLAKCESAGRNTFDTFGLDFNLGFVPPTFDPASRTRKEKTSVLLSAFDLNNKKKEYAERQRLLYVAMTRAREKLIIVSHSSKPVDEFEMDLVRGGDADKLLDIDIISASNSLYIASFWSLISRAIIGEHMDSSSFTLTKINDMDVINRCDEYFKDLHPSDEAQEGEEPDESSDDNKDEKQFLKAFRVPLVKPYQANPNEHVFLNGASASHVVPLKLSVSEIRMKRNTELTEDDISVEIPEASFLRENASHAKEKAPKSNLTGANIGTLVHAFLEHLDFTSLPEENNKETFVRKQIETLVSKGIMTQEEADAVPVPVLANFVVSDMARRISRADEISREVPFIDMVKYGVIEPACDPLERDIPVVVQGVIDLVLREGDRIVLVDYKTDGVSDDFTSYSQKYIPQVGLYAGVLRKVYGKLPDETYLYFLRAEHAESIEIKD